MGPHLKQEKMPASEDSLLQLRDFAAHLLNSLCTEPACARELAVAYLAGPRTYEAKTIEIHVLLER